MMVAYLRNCSIVSGASGAIDAIDYLIINARKSQVKFNVFLKKWQLLRLILQDLRGVHGMKSSRAPQTVHNGQTYPFWGHHFAENSFHLLFIHLT